MRVQAAGGNSFLWRPCLGCEIAHRLWPGTTRPVRGAIEQPPARRNWAVGMDLTSKGTAGDVVLLAQASRLGEIYDRCPSGEGDGI